MSSRAEVAMETIKRGGTGAATQTHIPEGTNGEPKLHITNTSTICR